MIKINIIAFIVTLALCWPGLSARELCDLLGMKSTTLRSKLDHLKRDGKIYAETSTVTHKHDFRCNVWFCVD